MFRIDTSFHLGLTFAGSDTPGIRSFIIDQKKQGQGLGTETCRMMSFYLRGANPIARGMYMLVHVSNAGAYKASTRINGVRINGVGDVETGQGIGFVYDDGVVDLVVSRCTELESGGRMIDSILINTLLPEISNHFLTHMPEGSPISKFEVTAEGGEFVYELSH